MIKFQVWDTEKREYIKTNCGKFLLDQDGKLWFREELPASNGKLEEVPNDYKVRWFSERVTND